MADGPITVPAPKVVTVDIKPELAPTLRLRTAAPSVWANRPNGAIHKPAQVRHISVNVLCVLQCLVLYVELTRDIVTSLKHS